MEDNIHLLDEIRDEISLRRGSHNINKSTLPKVKGRRESQDSGTLYDQSHLTSRINSLASTITKGPKGAERTNENFND